jgi:hypothetical protein
VAHRLGVVTVSILRNTANIWKIPDGEIDAEARRQLKLMATDPTGCDYLAATWRTPAARYRIEFEVIQDQQALFHRRNPRSGHHRQGPASCRADHGHLPGSGSPVLDLRRGRRWWLSGR